MHAVWYGHLEVVQVAVECCACHQLMRSHFLISVPAPVFVQARLRRQRPQLPQKLCPVLRLRARTRGRACFGFGHSHASAHAELWITHMSLKVIVELLAHGASQSRKIRNTVGKCPSKTSLPVCTIVPSPPHSLARPLADDFADLFLHIAEVSTQKVHAHTIASLSPRPWHPVERIPSLLFV